MFNEGKYMRQQTGRLKSQWMMVEGQRMHMRASVNPLPEGSPSIVLVHGLSVSSHYMVPTAIALAPYYHVYAPDLPGFGKSAKSAQMLTITQMADTLASWMQAMNLQQAVLLGNSLGCQTIVNFALRYPEKVTQAILAGPTMDSQARTLPQQALRLLRDCLHEPPSLLPLLTREYLAAGFRRTLRTVQYALDDPIEEELPQLHIPVLVVRGSRDPICTQRWVEEVAALLPNSQLAVISGAAHAVNYNAPQELASLVRCFLSERQEDASYPPPRGSQEALH